MRGVLHHGKGCYLMEYFQFCFDLLLLLQSHIQSQDLDSHDDLGGLVEGAVDSAPTAVPQDLQVVEIGG